jgi:Tol biopolymer transport system component
MAAREVHFDVEPAWSPDGKRLAFVRVDFTAQPGVVRRCVWTVDVETKHAEPLTTGGGEFAPSWSPRGAMLTFTAKRLLGLGERTDNQSNRNPGTSATNPAVVSGQRFRIVRLEGLPEIWLMGWNEKDKTQ